MSRSEQGFLDELRKVFRDEAKANLIALTAGLAAVQEKTDPSARHAAIESMHQAAHSLKSSARCVGLNAIGTICQSVENLLAAMKDGRLVPAPENLAVLQRAADRLDLMLAAPQDAPEADVSDLVVPLAAVLAAGATGAPAREAAPATRKPLNALLIEDSECDAMLLREELSHGGYEVHSQRVQDAQGLTAALATGRWDVIFSDHHMPNFDSTEALKLVQSAHKDIPFIIVSGSIGEEVAVAAMKAGAQDYLMKGNMTRLVAAVERELHDAGDRQARREAELALLTQKESLRIAREIQEHLFPLSPPNLPGFDIAGATCPADATGGDYYDFIQRPGGETFIVVGDVSGHGLGPALLMADVRAYLRALAMDYARIPDVLTRANHLLRNDLGDFRFITMLFAGLSPATRRLQFINAGHPPGYVLNRNGEVTFELSPCVAALGLDPEGVFPEAVDVPLDPGDLVVFLTDGAIEAAAPDGEEFGVARILEVVRRERHRPAADLIAILFDAVRKFTGAPAQQDDLSAVIIKVQSEPEVKS